MPHSRKSEEFWYTKKRNKSILLAPERHLILCEGTKTEPNYFKEIKNRINGKYRDKITVDIKPTGEGRLHLLQEAQEMVKRMKNKPNHVWLVYDKDDFPKDDFDNTVYKIKSINKKSKIKYHALWSNQCIEAWFLLHFIDLKVDITRKEYIEKITENWNRKGIKGSYIKNDTLIYNKLEKYQEKAIERAKKILKENKGKAPSKIAPASNVCEIIEKLITYLK